MGSIIPQNKLHNQVGSYSLQWLIDPYRFKMIQYLKKTPNTKWVGLDPPKKKPASVLIANHKGPTSPQQKQLVVLLI